LLLLSACLAGADSMPRALPPARPGRPAAALPPLGAARYPRQARVWRGWRARGWWSWWGAGMTELVGRGYDGTGGARVWRSAGVVV